MRAAQITKYSKNPHVQINEIPIPEIADNEVLVKVKAAAVNPLEMLIITGSVKLIQDYEFPLTLGNELTGVIEKVGKKVTEFHVGDAIYTRLPLEKLVLLRNMLQLTLPQLHQCPKICLTWKPLLHHWLDSQRIKVYMKNWRQSQVKLFSFQVDQAALVKWRYQSQRQWA